MFVSEDRLIRVRQWIMEGGQERRARRGHTTDHMTIHLPVSQSEKVALETGNRLHTVQDKKEWKDGGGRWSGKEIHQKWNEKSQKKNTPYLIARPHEHN